MLCGGQPALYYRIHEGQNQYSVYFYDAVVRAQSVTLFSCMRCKSEQVSF